MGWTRPGFTQQWRLIEMLLFFHAATFVLFLGKDGVSQALGVFPTTFWSRPWTAFTHQFVHGDSVFWFIINLFVLWIMGKALEGEWGSPKFLAFYLVSLLAPVVTSLLFNTPLVGNQWVDINMLLAFGVFFPDYEFLIFFVLPVKVKYLAWIAGALTFFAIVGSHLNTDGPINGLIHFAGLIAGFGYVMALRRLPSRRKLAHKARKLEGDLKEKSTLGGQLAKNTVWDPQVRAAEAIAAEGGPLDEELLAALDLAVDSTVTVCEPADFAYLDDPVCRSCSGFAECGARRIRLAAQSAEPVEEAS